MEAEGSNRDVLDRLAAFLPVRSHLCVAACVLPDLSSRSLRARVAASRLLHVCPSLQHTHCASPRLQCNLVRGCEELTAACACCLLQEACSQHPLFTAGRSIASDPSSRA
eukprot:284461-Rhodomonas_salina.2